VNAGTVGSNPTLSAISYLPLEDNYMERIIDPPKDIRYPRPKAVGPGYEIGKIIGRVKCQESFSDWGDYMRVLDLVEWNRNGHRWREIRFCQYFRKAGGGDNDWIFGQGAGHMGADTFYKLI
jgi:hypothetical protein